MRKSKHEIIDETAAYYNLNNRSIKSDGGNYCLYNGPNGKKCAFARMCADDIILTEGKNAANMLGWEGYHDKKPLNSMGDQGVLKEEYRGHSMEFYNAIQGLHDLVLNWTENGLSPQGVEVVKRLKERYKD